MSSQPWALRASVYSNGKSHPADRFEVVCSGCTPAELAPGSGAGVGPVAEVRETGGTRLDPRPAAPRTVAHWFGLPDPGWVAFACHGLELRCSRCGELHPARGQR